MADKNKDSINFDKLEKELNAAVEADERYWRENDAKFRAVHQKVATYDEFRDIVLAAHLKPLEKGDRFDQIAGFQQQWNVHATKNKNDTNIKKDNPMSQKSAKMPKNGHEFARDWRRHCKSSEDKYNMLVQIGHENLRRIFSAEISFGLLGELLAALSDFPDSDVGEVVHILDALSSANRLMLSLDFLSSKETEVCRNLFTKTSDILSSEDTTVHKDLTKIFIKCCDSYKIKF